MGSRVFGRKANTQIMRLIKLSEDHYVLTDDSEIGIGNTVAEKLLTGEYELFTIHTLNDIDKSSQKKITYSTQPESLGVGWMQSVQPLLLSEVKELLGVVDVEKSMWYERNLQNPYPLDSPSNTGFKKGFELAYNQALEDNKEKKYTEEDMRAVFMHGFLLGVDRGDYSRDMEDRALSNYTQPKTEWEVEMVDGKLKLKP